MLDINKLPNEIHLGNQNEKDVTVIEFDVSAWLDIYPGAAFSITYTQTETGPVYPATGVVLDGDTLRWTVGAAVTAVAGSGTMVIHCVKDGKELRSAKAWTAVTVGHAASEAAPQPLASYIAKWGAVDVEVTGLAAGATPTAAITQDADGTHLALGVPKGDKGDKGDTGAQGPAGSDATVTVDSALNENSTNPIQNKAVNDALSGLTPTSYSGLKHTLNNPYATGGILHLKGQIHGHTTGSDGVQTPAEFVNAYKAAGYDFITITDHDVVTTDPGVSGITFIGVGVEDGNSVRHCPAYDTDASGKSSAQDIIDYHHAKNKLVCVAHPFWLVAGSTKPYTREEIQGLRDFNFIEVYNTTNEVSGAIGKSIPREQYWDWVLSVGKHVFATAVDDCHNTTQNAYFNKAWIVAHVSENTKNAILSAMRAGNFYASTGNDITISVVGNVITASSGASSNFTFIGKDGRILKTSTGVTSATYTVLGDEMYVRVVSALASDTTKIAWGQPVFIESVGGDSRIPTNYAESFKTDMAQQSAVNGNFDIWQLGTTFSAPGNGTTNNLYTADQWRLGVFLSSGTINLTKGVLTPGEIWGSYNYLRLASTTAQSTASAGVYATVTQFIEKGTRYLSKAAGKLTMSFWARSDVVGKRIGVEIQQVFGTGGSPSSSVILPGGAITLSTFWEKYTVTVNTLALTGKTFGTNNDDYMRITFYGVWGSNFIARINPNGTAEGFSSAGYIDIAQVNLGSGTFYPKTEAQELWACQRYTQIRSTGTISELDLCPKMYKTPTVTDLTGSFKYVASIVD